MATGRKSYRPLLRPRSSPAYENVAAVAGRGRCAAAKLRRCGAPQPSAAKRGGELVELRHARPDATGQCLLLLLALPDDRMLWLFRPTELKI